MMGKTRSIKLLDLIIMVAATAFGFAFYRYYVRIEDFSLHSPVILNTTPVISLWTIGFVIPATSASTAPRSEAFPQPGMAACSTSVIVMTGYLSIRLLGLEMASIGGEFEGQSVVFWFDTVFGELHYLIGFSVLAVWLNLAMTGRWFAEKKSDRLARTAARWFTGSGLL